MNFSCMLNTTENGIVYAAFRKGLIQLKFWIQQGFPQDVT